jgi:multiple sugar transport system substrate-binding protein
VTGHIDRPGRSWVRISAAAAAGTLALVACSSSSASSNSGSSASKVLSIAFSSEYVMATAKLAPEYYGQIKKDFEAANPGVTVNLVPIKGGPNDITTKLALLYRSPSTAPTISQMFDSDVAKFSGAGYLMPVDKYLPSTNWWGGFPKAVQQMGTFNGHVESISQGVNTQALMYNKLDFQKAGLPVPWQPKTWQDVLDAAKTIKAKIPGLTPIWAEGGTSDGTEGVVLGVGNFLQASSDPTVFDSSTNKYVVDSPGLRETFDFIHQLTVNGLNAPVSAVFDPNATGIANGYMKTPGAAIGLASNYWGASWIANNAPEWKASAQIVGMAPLPTSNAQGNGSATLMSGLQQAIYAKAPNPDLAFKLLDFMNQKDSMLKAANDIELVPPVVQYTTDPVYLNFAAPFQAGFAKFLPTAQSWPLRGDFGPWSLGFQQATGALIQNPSTTVDQAINIMKTVTTQQLGPDKVESHSP